MPNQPFSLSPPLLEHRCHKSETVLLSHGSLMFCSFLSVLSSLCCSCCLPFTASFLCPFHPAVEPTHFLCVFFFFSVLKFLFLLYIFFPVASFFFVDAFHFSISFNCCCNCLLKHFYEGSFKIFVGYFGHFRYLEPSSVNGLFSFSLRSSCVFGITSHF